MNHWFDYYSCICELVILTVAVYCEGIQSDVSLIIFQATFYEWVTEFKSDCLVDIFVCVIKTNYECYGTVKLLSLN